MRYRVVLTPAAARQYRKFRDRRVVSRIKMALKGLAVDPRPIGAKKMTGVDGYRIRVGDYRIVYKVVDSRKLVKVARIGHRGEIYR